MSKPIIKDDSDQEKLKKCIEVCPMNVFEEKDGKVIVAKPDDCIGCKACEAASDNAVVVEE